LDEIYPGYAIYFIMFCTYDRKELLANSVVHGPFREFFVSAGKRNVLVGRYVIMPDHVHLFVDVGELVEISAWIKSLKNSVSKTLRQLGGRPPHWQKGYFDHLVRSEESYGEKWIYVRENPVRKGL
jgi:putative transposase